ncbi:UNVERIFIED_CONTAM: ola1 [Trichonephila clavipes]
MPPKKKDDEPERPALLGRLGTNLKVGLVGLPNVGNLFVPLKRFTSSEVEKIVDLLEPKSSDSNAEIGNETPIKTYLSLMQQIKSTLFNILTNSQVAAENFPFCTIDPNENKYI